MLPNPQKSFYPFHPIFSRSILNLAIIVPKTGYSIGSFSVSRQIPQGQAPVQKPQPMQRSGIDDIFVLLPLQVVPGDRVLRAEGLAEAAVAAGAAGGAAGGAGDGILEAEQPRVVVFELHPLRIDGGKLVVGLLPSPEQVVDRPGGHPARPDRLGEEAQADGVADGEDLRDRWSGTSR